MTDLNFKKFLKEKNEDGGAKIIDHIVSELSDRTAATEILESAVTIVAMLGKNFKIGELRSFLKHPEFPPKAAKWYVTMLKSQSRHQAIKEWILFTGGVTSKLGKIHDFIHANINQRYYNIAPDAFLVPSSEKANTADIVLFSKGKADRFERVILDMSNLSKSEQKARIKTDKSTGKVTLLNASGKEIIGFYQVSLKKGQGQARLGKVSAFVIQNFLQGISPTSPSKSSELAQLTFEETEIPIEYEDELQEGVIGDLLQSGFDLFKKISSKVMEFIEAGIDSFLDWVNKKFNKKSAEFKDNLKSSSNGILASSPGLKAAGSILNGAGFNVLGESVDLTEFAKKGQKLVLTEKDIKELEIMEKEWLKKDSLNKTHLRNIKMINSLNKSFADKSRSQVPVIIAPNKNQGKIDKKDLIKLFKSIKKKPGATIGRDQLQPILKIAMNYSANLIIFSILKNLERSMSDYENLSAALFALSASFNAEAKFGNTSLPLVILFGGKNSTIKVLGTRKNFEKNQVKELLKRGKNIDDFPICVIKVKKAQGQIYNTTSMLLVTNFKMMGTKSMPEPQWLIFEIATQSGSAFTVKIEANSFTSNWRGRE